jgi:hypothetical protein
MIFNHSSVHYIVRIITSIVYKKYSSNYKFVPSYKKYVSRLAKDRLFVEIGKKEFPLIVGDYGVPVVSRISP